MPFYNPSQSWRNLAHPDFFLCLLLLYFVLTLILFQFWAKFVRVRIDHLRNRLNFDLNKSRQKIAVDILGFGANSTAFIIPEFRAIFEFRAISCFK
jgi:hypothetical protein